MKETKPGKACPNRTLNAEVSAFIISVLPLSRGIMFPARAGSTGVRSGTAMTVPMVVAMFFLLRQGCGSLAAIGWRLPRWPYGLCAVGLPILMLAVVLLIDPGSDDED